MRGTYLDVPILETLNLVKKKVKRLDQPETPDQGLAIHPWVLGEAETMLEGRKVKAAKLPPESFLEALESKIKSDQCKKS